MAFKAYKKHLLPRIVVTQVTSISFTFTFAFTNQLVAVTKRKEIISNMKQAGRQTSSLTYNNRHVRVLSERRDAQHSSDVVKVGSMIWHLRRLLKAKRKDEKEIRIGTEKR